mgnify:FL=1
MCRDPRMLPKGILVLVAIIIAWMGVPRGGLGSQSARAAGTNRASLPFPPEEPYPTGLSWHGTKSLEIQYMTINGEPLTGEKIDLGPSFVLNQSFQAQVTGIWPGIWLQGTFDDDPFFPQYSLTVDMPQGSATLGDVDTHLLSPPLSPLNLALSGAQGRLNTGPLTLALVAGHSQAISQEDIFVIGPSGSIYQTNLFPIIPGTEIVQMESTLLIRGTDYFIDYELGQMELLRWQPGGRKLTIGYQITHDVPGKKPLVQGYRAQYQTQWGNLGITHLTKSGQENSTDPHWPLASESESNPASSKLTWSALSWEQGTGTISPHLAAEIWRRTFRPADLAKPTVEDMETRILRQSLHGEIAHPHRWTAPEASLGSSLELSRETGWIPTESTSRSALQLGFILEGSGSWAKTTLPLAKAVNLAGDAPLLLTLGIPQPLPGIKLEISLNSRAGSSYTQSVALGTLVGWQDLVLSPESWTSLGIPTWEEITSIQVRLKNGLPGTARGQVVLGALDVSRTNKGEDRWYALPPQEHDIEITTIALPHAPWMPPPGNTALSVEIRQTFPPRAPNGNSPQICGELPRDFSLSEAAAVTFWAHTPTLGPEITVWLLNGHGEPYGPWPMQLVPGWQEYTIPLGKVSAHLTNDTISMVGLSINPGPGSESTTILLDEWQLQDVQFTESYMARFAAEQRFGSIDWQLTGSGQTRGFRWDAPGMSLNVPHPDHLRLQATIHGPSDKETTIAVMQEGTTNGQTTLQVDTSTWDQSNLKAHITLPNGTSLAGDTAPVTGQIDFQTTGQATNWELFAFQKTSKSLFTQPSQSSTHRGLAWGMERQLPMGVLHLGSWYLGEGERGQTLSGDLNWKLSAALPMRTVFRLHRYHASPTALGENSGFGLWEAHWQSPSQHLTIDGSLEQRQGREIYSFTKGKSQLRQEGIANFVERAFSLDDSGEDSRLWQQKAALVWQWRLTPMITCQGQWQHDARRDLDQGATSQDDRGSLSVIWPWPGKETWQGKAAFSQSHSLRADTKTVTTTEYELTSEGPWDEGWYGRLRASHRTRQWQWTGKGDRWALEGDVDHLYSPQGSLGWGVAASYQTAPHLGGSHLDTGYTSHSSLRNLWSAGTGDSLTPSYVGSSAMDASGTYLSTELRWALAQEIIYKANVGALTHLPLGGGPSIQSYYGQAGMEKTWGALGRGHVELATELGSHTAWALGLGWIKELTKGKGGLCMEASLRHVQGADYQMTATSLGLEYRF